MKLFTINTVYIIAQISKVATEPDASTGKDASNKPGASTEKEKNLLDFTNKPQPIRMISKPFYIYTKTGLFGTVDSNSRNRCIERVIENTKKYLSQMEPWDDISEKKRSLNRILCYLWKNIAERLSSVGFKDGYSSMTQKIVNLFESAFISNSSCDFLQEYLNYNENKVEKPSFFQWLIDFFRKILNFIFGEKNKDDNDSFETRYIKQLYEFKKERREWIVQQNKDLSGEVINLPTKDAIFSVGELLVSIEIRQIIIPEDLKVHNKLKNELGILLAATKLMNFDDLQGSKFKNLLSLDTDIKKFMGDINSKLEGFESGKCRNKMNFITKFLFDNRLTVENIISEWMRQVFTNNPDKTAILKEYIEYLHQASTNFNKIDD